MGWEGDAILFNDQANDEELVCDLSYFIYVSTNESKKPKENFQKRPGCANPTDCGEDFRDKTSSITSTLSLSHLFLCFSLNQTASRRLVSSSP